MPQVALRPARTADVRAIATLIDTYAPERRLLVKPAVALYEGIQEFRVAELDGAVVGCGALHVFWEDLAEIRTVAVDPARRGHRIGQRIVTELLDNARALGLSRVFVLTFEVEFFARHGFRVIEESPVDTTVYQELMRSADEGVAEFLELERVKPNTLGNTRMLRYL
ncbi:amino-acid N-acetyltransferase [Actinocatenispora rupis]|uniref:amino-acid N-acetyltransferase n=1 Tax=Actinocatenispora rupis TaxID=519421 RepID=UPI0019404327|nr:amino-acid N-acetyltransferase [Actinocatenispora rupis]